jgi:hypothetical protein
MSGRVAPVSLEADDAIELAEMLEFLANWIGEDRTLLHRSLIRFAGCPVDDAGLQADLRRFAFLLGGCDPRLVFGDDEEGER